MDSLTLSELSLLHLVSSKRMTSETLRPFVRAHGLLSRELIEERHGLVYVTPMGREALHAFGDKDRGLRVMSIFGTSPRRQFRDLHR